MTFNEFKTKVKSLLLYDQDSEDSQVVSYIDALIVEWMYEAMFYVDNYRVGNTDTFLPAGVDVKCEGGRVDLPAELYKLESVAIVKKAADGDTVDSYIVSGAGVPEVNGEYLRDGEVYSLPAYTLYDDDGVTELYRMEADPFLSRWYIYSASNVPYYVVFLSESPTPPSTGWESADDDSQEATPSVLPSEPTLGCETVIDLDPVAWDQRDEILNGKHCNKYTVDSRATEIYFRPVPEDNEETGETQWLRVEWEGQKTDYSGEETVPYRFDAAKNCADFINMNLAVKKNDKPAKANRFEKMFDRGMQRLYKTQRDKSQQG